MKRIKELEPKQIQALYILWDYTEENPCSLLDFVKVYKPTHFIKHRPKSIQPITNAEGKSIGISTLRARHDTQFVAGFGKVLRPLLIAKYIQCKRVNDKTRYYIAPKGVKYLKALD